MAQPEQRRKYPRYAVDRDVTVVIDGSALHGHLVDVSDGGAFVKLSIEVAVGADVLLALQGEDVEARAAVQRVAAEGFAIRFDRETVGRIVGTAARKPGGERR